MIDNTQESRPTVAVVGATGRQGSAAVGALLAAGVSVRALVRDRSKDAARSLAEAGAELVTADLEDSASLVRAFRGTDAISAMTTFAVPGGVDGEVEYGRRIGDAAVEAGVHRMVYSSVGGAERRTGIPHFESKRRIEEYLDDLELQVTHLRPTFFMENFSSFVQAAPDGGELVVRLPLPDGVPLQMVAVRDIGIAAATLLLDGSAEGSGSVEISGDELTGSQVAEVFGSVREVPAHYEALPLSALDENPDLQAMFSWFVRLPAYQADVAASRRLVPDLLDLRAWVEQEL